jgi:ribonucleoside-diphosphate reductase alpha chain
MLWTNNDENGEAILLSVAFLKDTKVNVEQLNKDIMNFPQVFPITEDMKVTHQGVSRLVMLDRYAFKDTKKKSLKVGDFVVLTIKEDPKFPARGLGYIVEINKEDNIAVVQVEEEYQSVLEGEAFNTGLVTQSIDVIDKPLEIFYEQIAKRNATGLASVEKTEEKRLEAFEKFYEQLVNLNFIPAGRVLYGAGAETDVTYFNCVCNVA